MNESEIQRAIAAHNLALAAELLRIDAAFRQVHIPFLTWKGPVFAQLLYGEFTQRRFHDLDLLLHQADLERAGAVLRSLGYQAALNLSPAQHRSFLRHHHEQVFTCAPDFIIELHWQIAQRQFAVDYPISQIFERAQHVHFQGKDLLHTGPEDTLVLAAVHAAKHLWIHPDLLRDLAKSVALVRDWPLAWEIARSVHVERYLASGLLLAARLNNIALPKEVEARARADRTAVRIANAYAHQYTLDTVFGLAWARYLGRERLRDRLRSALRTIVTPTMNDWLSTSIPDRLFFLYYFTRQARLVRGVFARVLHIS